MQLTKTFHTWKKDLRSWMLYSNIQIFDWTYIDQYSPFSINPFVPNAPFLYLLKTTENRNVFLRFSDFFRGKRKVALGANSLKEQLCSSVRPLLRKSYSVSSFFVALWWVMWLLCIYYFWNNTFYKMVQSISIAYCIVHVRQF